MRNWGIVVTAFYALVVFLLSGFGVILLAEGWDAFATWDQSDFGELLLYSLIPMAFLVSGQALLLFLSVDTSWRRLKPQRHAKVTAGLVGLMVTILFFAILLAILMAIWGDNFDIGIADWFEDTWAENMSEDLVSILLVLSVPLIWLIWGAVFYTYSKRRSNVVETAVNWLIKGSVLELLVAVPCHIIVRQRDWCCAQYASAWGIATGIAIMLMAFGPSALFLYKRKLGEYKLRPSETEPDND